MAAKIEVKDVSLPSFFGVEMIVTLTPRVLACNFHLGQTNA